VHSFVELHVYPGQQEAEPVPQDVPYTKQAGQADPVITVGISVYTIYTGCVCSGTLVLSRSAVAGHVFPLGFGLANRNGITNIIVAL
jgi:hypothetical protein